MKYPEVQIHEEFISKIISRTIKRLIFKAITGPSCILFLKGRDIISIDPQVLGIHEEGLTKLIRHYSKSGFNDFLLDIGANIGLISCQSGMEFKEIHMFEPNPLCCNILEVNANISLKASQFYIHRYGLGDADKNCTLTVPKQNWGGAFVKDDGNSYTDQILAAKDCYKSLNDENYFEAKILIKETAKELKEIFSSLYKKGLKKGLVKIDVEGYEETVLIGIANAIPLDISVVIVFESWDKDFNISKVINAFKGRCVAKKINRQVPWKDEWSKFRKFASLLVNPIIKTNVGNLCNHDLRGDIILEINN